MSSNATIRPGYIHHIFLRTRRFDAMRAFYKLVLGCEAFFENEMFSWLSFDREHHRIAIANMPQSQDQAPTQEGLDHVGYQYAGPEDLFATYERLRDLGIRPYWCTDHGGTTSFYYKDPDGNGLELQYDNYPNRDALLEWMKGGDFARNPIGVDVDPERLIETFRTGLDRLELHRRSRRGEFLPEGMSMAAPAAPFPADPVAYMISIRRAVGAGPE